MKIADMDKAALMKTPYFHLVDPRKLEGIEDYAFWLEAILNNPCSVWQEENGDERLIEIRHLVSKVRGLKIEIYSNEHPPPHFHVVSSEVMASFAIANCELLDGTVDSKNLKKIQYWHRHSKRLLVDIWNSTRPTKCVVGRFVEN